MKTNYTSLMQRDGMGWGFGEEKTNPIGREVLISPEPPYIQSKKTLEEKLKQARIQRNGYIQENIQLRREVAKLKTENKNYENYINLHSSPPKQ